MLNFKADFARFCAVSTVKKNVWSSIHKCHFWFGTNSSYEYFFFTKGHNGTKLAVILSLTQKTSLLRGKHIVWKKGDTKTHVTAYVTLLSLHIHNEQQTQFSVTNYINKVNNFFPKQLILFSYVLFIKSKSSSSFGPNHHNYIHYSSSLSELGK